jgi:predicted nucleotide-binding protein with TIR-like domain
MGALLLLVAKEAAHQQLAARVDEGKELLNEPIQSQDDYRRVRDNQTRWNAYNVQLLKTLFDDSAIADEYTPKGPGIYFAKTLPQSIQDLHRDIEFSLTRLRSLLDRLPLFIEAPGIVNQTPSVRPQGSDVFIVHGHGGREDSVALVVVRVGLTPVILRDELHRGSTTLIEKLEREAKRCGYAVVIVTGDDEGRKVGSHDKLKLRARQNVVLELGYFVALLGRENVTILHDPAVDIPSDFNGVGYYPLDEAEAWKGRLAGELQHAKTAWAGQRNP